MPLQGNPATGSRPGWGCARSAACRRRSDIVYFVAFWAWRGQTPGMMPFKLRVVRADVWRRQTYSMWLSRAVVRIRAQ